ncbi:MAG TPA: hypothetical protein VIY29_28165 [Ktedonobacteraceae bacterium]
MSEIAQLRGQIERGRETLEHLVDKEEANSNFFETNMRAVS